MKKYLTAAVAGALISLVAGEVPAASIDIAAGAPGVLSPGLPGATVLGFDNLPVGGLPSYQFNGGALSGSGAIENTSLVGKYAQPAGDTTNFLTVSYPSAAGAVHFAFTNPENYFGLYWGSMDPYNSITFLRDNEQIATYTGTEIVGLAGLVANGDQHSTASNRYINFDLGSGFYDEVILGTTDYAFEVDNIAFGDPPVPSFTADTFGSVSTLAISTDGIVIVDAPAPIPEPGTLVVLGSSLYGLAFMRRRKAA